ncbi:MAG: hypothetical protein ABMA64_37950, partial [Myxococcota bacterium]
MLHDDSIDARLADGQPLADAIAWWWHDEPTVDAIRAAARAYDDASPAMIESAAKWFAIDDRLVAAGWTPEDLVHVYARASIRAYEPHGADEPVLRRAFDRVDSAVLEALADELLQRERDPFRDGLVGAVALEVLARRGPVDPRLDALVSLYRSPRSARAVLEALPADRRRACLDAVTAEPLNTMNGVWRVERALPLRDLLTPDQEQALAVRVDALRGHADEDGRYVDAIARFDAGGVEPLPIPAADGLTDGTRSAVEYLVSKLDDRERAQRLGAIAEARLDLAIRVDAPEAWSLEAWAAATDARRDEIGRAIAEAGGLTFDGVDRPAEWPVARFRRGDVAMVLIPGGSYRRGFSEAEEAAVRAAEAEQEGEENGYEEFGSLLDGAGSMRPVVEVTIGPVLLGVRPIEPLKPAAAADALAASPFRLPTEAEHERAARGGREGQVTYSGDRVVDEDWMFAQPPHPFGLELVGHYPEACADVYVAGYVGAPTVGTARVGPGPRVFRGGAAMVSPWQECG